MKKLWLDTGSFNPILGRRIVAEGTSNFNGKKDFQIGKAVKQKNGMFGVVNSGEGLRDVTKFYYLELPKPSNTK